MNHYDLNTLGFSPFFQQQILIDETERCDVARVIEVQRSGVTVSNGNRHWPVPLIAAWHEAALEQRPAVGDWVLIDRERGVLSRVLDRSSLFKRVAAGENAQIQLIAANVDTLFIVSSCNADFNESRLERYLSLAFEASVTPVVVLTKSDLAEAPDEYLERARSVQSTLPVEIVNALDKSSLSGLRAWISAGQTVAFVGSSGVGKSTLINTLLASSVTRTSAIREDDAKGRHTTSYRSLHVMREGGLLIDVPGMRELKVADIEDVLDDVFTDIADAARKCRFKDCSHAEEPGCAVLAAIDEGSITARRLRSFHKLQREDARNSASLDERRSQDRETTRLHKRIQADNRRRRNP